VALVVVSARVVRPGRAALLVFGGTLGVARIAPGLSTGGGTGRGVTMPSRKAGAFVLVLAFVALVGGVRT